MIDISSDSLKAIEASKDKMLQKLIQYAEINTGSFHVEGIKNFAHHLEKEGLKLGASSSYHPIEPYCYFDDHNQKCFRPLAPCLTLSKLKKGKPSILLVAHMDTVFAKDSPFQKVSFIKEGVIQGPGVADIKGGIVVMLEGLKAFEASPYASELGWEILFNSDEEIGSKSSERLFHSLAPKHQLGLVFEPCMENDALVASRKGSCNLSVLAEGRAAHAGRYFDKGINAIHALAKLLCQYIDHAPKDLSINLGTIKGGQSPNVVAPYAQSTLNIRGYNPQSLKKAYKQLEKDCQNFPSKANFTFHNHSYRSPKPKNEELASLMAEVTKVYEALGYPLTWADSGGVCDGNTLYEAGLCNLDTMGVRGGGLHTEKEFCYTASLVEKTQVLFLLLVVLSKNSRVLKN